MQRRADPFADRENAPRPQCPSCERHSYRTCRSFAKKVSLRDEDLRFCVILVGWGQLRRSFGEVAGLFVTRIADRAPIAQSIPIDLCTGAFGAPATHARRVSILNQRGPASIAFI